MSQSKEDLLLHAALKLFNEFGFHGTATAKISKEAGVSTGTLYNYFDSKEELISKLYIHIKSNMFEYVAVNVINNPEIENTLENIWSGMIKWAIDYPEYYKFKETFYRSPYVKNISTEEIMEVNKPLIDIVIAAFGTFDYKSKDAALITEFFTGALNATINYIGRCDDVDIDDAIHRGFTLLWSGIKDQIDN